MTSFTITPVAARSTALGHLFERASTTVTSAPPAGSRRRERRTGVALRHDVTRQAPPANDLGEAGLPRSVGRMLPSPIGSHFPRCRGGHSPGLCTRGVLRPSPSRKANPRRSVAGCPTCPRLRRQIDGCLKSPAHVPPIFGHRAVADRRSVPGARRTGPRRFTVNHQPSSLSLAAICCSP